VSHGLSKIDGFIARHNDVACLHARRVHLLADTELQINRFDSFLDTSYYLAAVACLLKQYEFVTAASDSSLFTNHIRHTAGEKFFSLEDIVDRRDYTGLQWALLEIYFLGTCRTIYGTLSAHTMAASIIGGAAFHNMFGFVFRENLAGIYKTGRIAFEQAKKQQHTVDFSEQIVRTSPQAALCCRLSFLPNLPAGLALELACRGLALRLIQHPHPSSVGDWRRFTAAIRRLRPGSQIMWLVEQIEAAIDKRWMPQVGAIADR
jgi:hypothetical protein